MQNIPFDILTHIGKWVPNEVCKAMLGAAKVFSGVCFGHEEHTMVIEQKKVKQSIKRMHKTFAYVRKIKPRMTTIKIKFDNIYDPPIWDAQHQKLPSKNVWIVFESCPIWVMRELIKWFEPGFKCDIKRTAALEPHNECDLYSEVNSIHEVITYMNSQPTITDVLKHPAVCNAENVFLYTSTYHIPSVVDMSHVNVEKNKVLALVLRTKCDIKCLNADKLTHIHWRLCDEMRQYTYEGLDVESSIANNPRIQNGKARIQRVTVNCDGLTHARHDSFLKLVKALLPCKDVKYYVDVSCPDMILLIYKMLDVGVKKENILYCCIHSYNMITRWIIARYCKLVYSDLDLDTHFTDTPLHLAHLKTEDELYNAMSYHDRQIWGGIYFARKSLIRNT